MSLSTEIFLSEKAFMGIILSTVEVYRSECLGVLLGYKTRGKIIVEYANPFQTADRKPSEVAPNWERELKVLEILPELIQLEKLGYFHSHPVWGKNKGLAILSDEDKDSMEEGEMELIVAINDVKRRTTWSESRKRLNGTLGKYRFTFAGYYKRTRDSRIRQYRIVCPYAVGFDYTFSE